MLAASASAFVLHVGQTEKLGHTRAGQVVTCIGRGDSIKATLPRERADANAYTYAFDKKLSLRIGPLHPSSPTHRGGLVARCTAR